MSAAWEWKWKFSCRFQSSLQHNCYSGDDSRVETGLVGLGDLKIGQGPIKE